MRLRCLQRRMAEHYSAYRRGKISQQEYLWRIKPIDRQIDSIELSCLTKLKCESS
ncbi:MAG: hypothetical protein L3J47_11460 [Sulfurovum sp.]|nr:hypothetical protein [Sulfurovum sp.]